MRSHRILERRRLPGAHVQMGFTAAGLPLSLQIAERAVDEGLVLRVGDAYQRITSWHLRVPPLVRELEQAGPR